METTLRRGVALIAVPLVAALTLSACGSGSESGSGRPTTDQLVTAFTTGKAGQELSQDMSVGGHLTSTEIQCLATAFENSKLSDGALRSFVNGDFNSYKPTSGDNAAISSLGTGITKCMAASIGGGKN